MVYPLRSTDTMTQLPQIVIVVDTNTMFEDVMLSGTRWTQLLSLCAKRRLRVAIPIVVLRERARHWETKASNAVEAARGRYERALRDRKAFMDLGLGTLEEPAPVPDVAIERGAAQERLVDRLTNVGVEILPLPKVTVAELLDRDLSGKKPFHKSGKGFRDALIWHSVMELLSSEGSDSVVYLVTDDSDDFRHDEHLHPDLQEDTDGLGGQLRLVRGLEELVEDEPISSLIAELAATDEQLQLFLARAAQLDPDEYSTASIGGLIRDALVAAASELIGEEISFGDDEWPSGPDFTEVAIPRLDSPTIVHVETRPNTAEWHTYETYEAETLLIRASIEADVEIEGFVYKSDYIGMEDEVSLIEFDWNDHMSFVAASVEARLVFQLRVESGAGVVEQAEFEQAESLLAYE